MLFVGLSLQISLFLSVFSALCIDAIYLYTQNKDKAQQNLAKNQRGTLISSLLFYFRSYNKSYGLGSFFLYLLIVLLAMSCISQSKFIFLCPFVLLSLGYSLFSNCSLSSRHDSSLSKSKAAYLLKNKKVRDSLAISFCSNNSSI